MFRVVAVYVAVALGVVQAASLIFGPLHLPSWTLTLVVVLALLGLPVAAVLAWAFETTPDGVRATAGGGRRTHAIGLVVGVVALTAAASAGVWWWLGAAALPFGARAASSAPNGPGPGSEAVADSASGEPAVFGETRLAVLPLANLSPDTADAYLARAMTEEITTRLGSVPGLAVVSQRSSARFADSKATDPQIADSLGVRYVLDGSVRSAGGRVAIDARLIDARSDVPVWSKRFERPAGGALQLEVDLARKIAASLRSSLTDREIQRIEAHATNDPAAYDLYLRARGVSGGSDSAYLKAVRLLRRAVRRDSTFAMAWFALGMNYRQLAVKPGTSWMDSARFALDHAVRFASDSVTRLALRAIRATALGGAADSLTPLLREAARHNPDDFRIVTFLAEFDRRDGDLVGAVRWRRKARDLDPMDAGEWVSLGALYMYLGLDERADRAAHRALELDPSSASAWSVLATVDLYSGHVRESLPLLDSIGKYADDPVLPAQRAQAYMRLGQMTRARTLLEQVFRSQPWELVHGYTPELVRTRLAAGDTSGDGALIARAEAWLRRHTDLTDAYYSLTQLAAVRGDAAEATRRLRTYIARGGTGMASFPDDPTLDPVRSDSAFQAAMAEGQARLARMRRQVQGMLARSGD